jgi:AcrR family transcriptional regulator
MTAKSILTKEKIVSAAIGLFNMKGYRATSLSDITRAAGFTKGAIYGNFKNKDAVAVAAFDYAIEKVTEQVRHAIKSAPDAPSKLKAITGYYRNYIKNPPIEGGCPIVNTAIEADDNHPQLRSRVIRTFGIFKESIRKIIYRGIREQQLSDSIDVDGFTLSLYSAVKGAIIISRTEGDLDTYAQVEKYLNQQIDNVTI